MILNFFLRFSTKFGQTLFVSGNHTILGNDDVSAATPLQYFNDQWWQGKIEIPASDLDTLHIEYRYILRDAEGHQVIEGGNDRIIEFKHSDAKDISLVDTWNHAGDVANVFFTQPFQDVY